MRQDLASMQLQKPFEQARVLQFKPVVEGYIDQGNKQYKAYDP